MNLKLLAVLFIPFMLLGFMGCEEESEDDDRSELYVKFENDSGSEYTITSVRIMVMGEAGGAIPDPVGEFSENVLPAGETIAPGGHVFLNLKIPNLHYAVYRLTVDDGTGNDIYLYDQEGYTNTYDGTITHWGGDDRTVDARVVWAESWQYIYVSAWGDNAGID